MVQICEDYATDYFIKFNRSVCSLLVFDKEKHWYININVADDKVMMSLSKTGLIPCESMTNLFLSYSV